MAIIASGTAFNYPSGRAEALDSGPFEAPEGVADATPVFWPPKVAMSTPRLRAVRACKRTARFCTQKLIPPLSGAAYIAAPTALHRETAVGIFGVRGECKSLTGNWLIGVAAFDSLGFLLQHRGIRDAMERGRLREV